MLCGLTHYMHAYRQTCIRRLLEHEREQDTATSGVEANNIAVKERREKTLYFSNEHAASFNATVSVAAGSGIVLAVVFTNEKYSRI